MFEHVKDLGVRPRSCLMYAFAASAESVKPALIAGFILGVFSSGVFMRQLLGVARLLAAAALCGD